MSNRPYPKILRTTEAADATLRAYARKAHLAPFEALILAIGLLRTKDERDAASERAYKFAALWHAIARAIWRRWQNACHLHDRMRDERDRAADQRDATTRAADTLRADLESAREATRRADAALESSHRSNRILAGRADAAEAEVARLTRELAGERLKTEAAQAREQQARTEAADLQVRRSSAAPCACALPDDLAARVKARIAARPGRDFAFVVKNGCDRLEGSDRYVDKKKAERMELDQ